jgi:hypothetical protein
MSRSGYSGDLEEWALIRWRGAVKSAIRGKRGQAFLREMLTAMDSLPRPRLIAWEIVQGVECCAIGSVALRRGMDVSNLDPEDRVNVASIFGQSEALVAEIAYVNDELYWGEREETPEERFRRVRAWIIENLESRTDAD